MVTVPGNHGEAVRINGKCVTRYDDSHGTESLIAVQDADELNPDRFDHVEFFVPGTDELIVIVKRSGTVVGHVHYHQWHPGKHFEWWKGHAFDQARPCNLVDLLLAGHLHHELLDTDRWRPFLQPPAWSSPSPARAECP